MTQEVKYYNVSEIKSRLMAEKKSNTKIHTGILFRYTNH